MVVDFIIMVVVIDVEVRVDGEDVRFVARASMGKGYHASRKSQPKFREIVTKVKLHQEKTREGHCGWGPFRPQKSGWSK
jgi:hypothetical protein